MPSASEHPEKSLPPPWDRIFSLTTRAFVWGLLIALLYVLRPFLLLVFMTFVFAYIQAHGVDGLAHRIKNRPARVIIVGLVFLGTLFATGFTLVPEIQSQANTFWENREKYIQQGDQELSKFLKQYPALYKSLAKHQQGTGLPDPITAFADNKVPGTIPRPKPPEPAQPDGVKSGGDEKQAPADGPPKEQPPETKPPVDPKSTANGGPTADDKPAEKLPENLFIVRDLLNSVIESLAKNPLEIGQSVIGYASSFLLSLLFSFLIVLDLSKIRRGITGLANTKVGFIYDEVADNIAGFGRVLGRALEAQLFIAICNTILTSIGLWMLGLTQSMLVLSAIVFVCSFIPVVGTFLSSTPICLLALQSGGVSTMVLAILMICLVHALETYVLNPQIYGHHMHMNPVLVLIVLTIGGKLFGVWGLILGIPIVNYVFRHAIRKPEERPAET
jgi:predicted PurR-regulated permease PerM